MNQAVASTLSADDRVAYGLIHGSVARGADHAASDLDVAIGLSVAMSRRELGELIGKLESATGRTVDLVVMTMRRRLSRTGCSETGWSCSNATMPRTRGAAPVRSSTTSTSSRSKTSAHAVSWPRPPMVDEALLARGIADIRDAVVRIRDLLPAERNAFLSDRTTREVVVLNLFVALQHCLSSAAHWLADEGRDVPSAYRDVMLALAQRSVLEQPLAQRLAAASGLRNPIANRYGVRDWARIHEIASNDLDDLLRFCEALARAARSRGRTRGPGA